MDGKSAGVEAVSIGDYFPEALCPIVPYWLTTGIEVEGILEGIMVLTVAV